MKYVGIPRSRKAIRRYVTMPRQLSFFSFFFCFLFSFLELDNNQCINMWESPFTTPCNPPHFPAVKTCTYLPTVDSGAAKPRSSRRVVGFRSWVHCKSSCVIVLTFVSGKEIVKRKENNIFKLMCMQWNTACKAIFPRGVLFLPHNNPVK